MRQRRANVTSVELGGSTNLAVLAPIKPGFVDGFETVTYLDRLHKLLAAVNASRQAAREAALLPAAFPDAIGRFGIIRTFRYTIFPPYPADPDGGGVDAGGRHWLTLNITFDGGWEPYMRVIYRDIGTLLDALFANCVGYPGSRKADFDTYCRWVRENEMPNGTFYNDAPLTVADQHYHAELDRRRRSGASPAELAGFALPSDAARDQLAAAAARSTAVRTALTSLRLVKGFYRLAPFYPRNLEREDLILVRFAWQVLQEFRSLLPDLMAGRLGTQADQPVMALLRMAFADELTWFSQPDAAPSAAEADPPWVPALLQAGIAAGYDAITHGCVAMLRVDPDQADRAATSLASDFKVSVPGQADAGGIRRNVAFTAAGLRALGVHPLRIDRLAPEFLQGMQARAGLLGDVHGNHPDAWPRPLLNWRNGKPWQGHERFDPAAVDLVIVLRLSDPSVASAALHPMLQAELAAIEQAAGGSLVVLGVEAMRSYPDPATGKPREHFGFLDGFSQPLPAALPLADPRPTDQVWPGEIALGHRNERGDAPGYTRAELLLNNGSYLVVRKLRQHLDALDAALSAHPNPTDALERMVGRRQDGTPLVAAGASLGNGYDYGADRLDREGARCPFHAHARRANPRDGRPALPRIARRGMSYGERSTSAADRADDRGIVFMAYCASIAEQFEVIQRWLAGGNSSGGSSQQADPLLGVPVPGQARPLEWRVGDTVQRLDLGARPLVSLQWGMYLFAPSVAALKALAGELRTAPPPRNDPVLPADDPDALEIERRRFEDSERGKAAWRQAVGHGDAGEQTAYGRMIGTPTGVAKALMDPALSVAGYGARMDASIGLGYLGQDDPDHARYADPVNRCIAAWTEPNTYPVARIGVDKAVAGFVQLAALAPDAARRVPIDLISFSERVLGGLCTHWFGLPDDALMVQGGRVPEASPARCPGHLFTTSRYIFAPRPTVPVQQQGQAQGAKVLEAFDARVSGQGGLGELGESIRRALIGDAKVPPTDHHQIALTIAGVMLGFPPTVHGNFLRVIAEWLKTEKLWDLQARLLALRPLPADDTPVLRYTRASKVLGAEILAAMAKDPVPGMIWRTDKVQAAPDPRQPPAEALVVLGLASAMAEGGDHTLMFGGDYSGKAGLKAPHSCPGYGMAMGVLLALTSGLLEAGSLRPTGSSIALTLIP